MNEDKELKYAFVVGPSALKKLTELLQDHIGKVNVYAEYADGTLHGTRQRLETVNDLIAYENPKSKEIRRVYLDAHSNDYSRRVKIVFPSYSERGILINFPKHGHIGLWEKIQDIIEGTRPWYHKLTFIRPIPAYIAPFVILVGLRSVRRWLTLNPKVEIQHSLIVLLIALLIVLCVVIFGGSKLWSFCFPRVVFTIGQGKSRFKDQERFQWGVGIAFMVSLAAGLTDSLGGLTIAIWKTIFG